MNCLKVEIVKNKIIGFNVCNYLNKEKMDGSVSHESLTAKRSIKEVMI